MALVVVVCWCGLWVYLGVTEFKLGPHRYDDFRYATNAIRGTFDYGIRFRYWHVWGLRLVYGLIDDRITAAAAYASLVHAGLIGLAFWFGWRAGGYLAGAFAALLLPFFPPLLNFISTPLTDPPCLLYGGLAIALALPARDQQPGAVRAALCGLCCFASIRCKETGIATVPVTLALLGGDRERRWALYRAWLGGAVAGQVVLSLADWIIVGDPFVGLRLRVFEKYTGALSGQPKVIKSRRNLMRDEWMQLLLNPGTRDFTLLGLVGLAWGVRRNRVVAALGGFGLCVMLFSAWVSWRYSGIDAHIRYLGPLALSLVVPAGWVLAQAWHGLAEHGQAAAAEDDGALGQALRDPVRWIGFACGVGLAWLSARGLWAGFQDLTQGRLDYPDERAAYFLLPLIPTLGLMTALSGRGRWPRRMAIVAVLLAVGLMAWPVTQRYLKGAERNIAAWHSFARYVKRERITSIQRFRTKEPHIQANLLRWRLMALGGTRSDFVEVTDFESLSDVDGRQLLLIDRQRQAALKEARSAGWKTVLALRRNKRRLIVLRHEDYVRSAHSVVPAPVVPSPVVR